MATTEQFSLRWNNFHSNLTSGFHDLLQANDMVDVTLAVEGQFLQAHKLVLSICSPLFKQLFKINPCKHPVVILRDVTYGNLKDILEFMYLGEVNVLRDNLSGFLRTAELLQVKGLTGDDSSDTSSRKDEKIDSICDNDLEQDMQQFSQLMESSESALMSHYSTSSRLTSPPSHPTTLCNVKRPSKNTPGNTKRSKTSDSNLNQSTKSSAKSNSKSDRSFTPNQIPGDNEESEYIETPNIKMETMSYGSECEETLPNQEVIKHFLESNNVNTTTAHDSTSQDHGKAEGVRNHPPQHHHSYRCEKCTKRFSRRDHLRTHEKNIHGEDAGPFACIMCSQLYKNSESLRKHIAKFHYQKNNDLYQKIQTDVLG